jgi:phage terminase large subunit-like protein
MIGHHEKDLQTRLGLGHNIAFQHDNSSMPSTTSSASMSVDPPPDSSENSSSGVIEVQSDLDHTVYSIAEKSIDKSVPDQRKNETWIAAARRMALDDPRREEYYERAIQEIEDR